MPGIYNSLDPAIINSPLLGQQQPHQANIELQGALGTPTGPVAPMDTQGQPAGFFDQANTQMLQALQAPSNQSQWGSSFMNPPASNDPTSGSQIPTFKTTNDAPAPANMYSPLLTPPPPTMAAPPQAIY